MATTSETIHRNRAAYVGIDVACAKGKRLPVCIAVRREGRLEPLPVRKVPELAPPRGGGNRAAINPNAVERFARDALTCLQNMERSCGVSIARVAIDAPSAPKRHGIPRRAAERAMDRRGISCFATPSQAEFQRIIALSQAHLDAGGAVSRIPHANQLWMLVGFELFSVLEAQYSCLEVYPNAIVRALGVGGIHKSSPAGLEAQLRAIAVRTGWDASELSDRLPKCVYGSAHDRLDAYLAAWVASLPESQREACGVPGDSIWIPRVDSVTEMGD